jgi:hypothetical protein
MKTHALAFPFFALLLGASFCLPSSIPAADLKVDLKGLVDIGGTKTAYLELTPPIGGTSSVILREGERMGEIELIKADLLQRKVVARIQGEVKDLSFDAGDPKAIPVRSSSAGLAPTNSVTVCLDKLGLGQTLKLYASLANRTVLRPFQLPTFELSLRSEGSISGPDLMGAVASALKEKDILVSPHGDKFVIVARAGQLELVSPELKAASDNLSLASGANAGELLPPGMINFPSTDVNQVLQIYQELVNRTVIRPTALPAQLMVFSNHNPLTRSELNYALTATLALNGVSVMPAGDKFVFVFPTALKIQATEILARKPVTSAVGTGPIPAGGVNLNAASLSMVAKLLQDLSGQALESDAALPDVRIILRNQTPLTPAEALQGFEYALGWNGLVIEKKGDKLFLKRADGSR